MKDVYYFFYDVFDGSMQFCFVYKIMFNREVTKQYFENVMRLAKEQGDSYAILYDRTFQEKYYIKSVIEVPADWNDYKEDI